MTEQVKLYKFDPITHQFSDDYSNAKGHECFAIVNPTTKKTSLCSSPHLEDIQLFCPNTYNLPPTINNNIEVNPNITTGSSLKRNAMMFAAGAITTIAVIQFGPSIATYTFLSAAQIIKNITYNIGTSTITKALGIITNTGSYFSSFLGLTNIVNPTEIIPTKIEDTIDPTKAFDLSYIKPPASIFTTNRILTAAIGIATLGMVRSKI